MTYAEFAAVVRAAGGTPTRIPYGPYAGQLGFRYPAGMVLPSSLWPLPQVWTSGSGSAVYYYRLAPADVRAADGSAQASDAADIAAGAAVQRIENAVTSLNPFNGWAAMIGVQPSTLKLAAGALGALWLWKTFAPGGRR